MRIFDYNIVNTNEGVRTIEHVASVDLGAVIAIKIANNGELLVQGSGQKNLLLPFSDESFKEITAAWKALTPGLYDFSVLRASQQLDGDGEPLLDAEPTVMHVATVDLGKVTGIKVLGGGAEILLQTTGPKGLLLPFTQEAFNALIVAWKAHVGDITLRTVNGQLTGSPVAQLNAPAAS